MAVLSAGRRGWARLSWSLVNAGMVYAALHSFPGEAGDEGFALSNHYDAVLEREQREAALGWTVRRGPTRRARRR